MQELLAIARTIPKERWSREHFKHWAVYVDSEHKWPVHLMKLADALTAVEAGKIKRLIIALPPRHGKSETVSAKFPSWYIGRNPNRRVILTSHTASLAEEYSLRNREYLAMYGKEVFGVRLSDIKARADDWKVYGMQGGIRAAGVGGSITGRGADLLILDDPFSNYQEAHSKTQRDHIWNWWRAVAFPRLEPEGAAVVVSTRWHEDDLVGRILKTAEETGEKWTILKMPAIAEEDNPYDPTGRKPGEALWPERYPLEELVKIRKTLGSYIWSALYQQQPQPQEGGILKRNWWKFYRELPSQFDELIQSWDMAFKDTDGSDYVVGQVWGRKGADKYLLDQIRDRMDFPATVQAVRSLSAKWPQAHAKLVEDKANGPAVIATLKREISGLIPVNPEGGKEVRAVAVSAQIEAGNVYLPDPSLAPWIHDFIEECTVFPNGLHDDQVDAMTQALLRLEHSGWIPPISRI